MIDADFRLRLVDHDKSRLFVQNGELHTHGVGAPDLGLGAHRNAVILNAVCGREVLPVRSRNVFQTFGSDPVVSVTPTFPPSSASTPTAGSGPTASCWPSSSPSSCSRSC